MTVTTRPELDGTFGAVATTHWIPAAIGMSILERGGNAFDAACAVGFALQVVEPHLNGPGGELVGVLCAASGSHAGQPRILCGQGFAPGAATIERMRAEGLEFMPGTGPISACVPGAFDAWMLLLLEHGTMRPRDVLEPAMLLARDGYPLLPRIAMTIGTVRDLFRKHWPTSADVYLKHGEPPRGRELFTNPALARTFARLIDAAEAAGASREAQIDAARDAYYRGFVAEACVRFCEAAAMDASGKPHRGLLSLEDFAVYRAQFEDPIVYQYDNLTIAKAGPWTQGPVFLQQLALRQARGATRWLESARPEASVAPLAEGFPPHAGDDQRALRPSADAVHATVECAKLALADREAWYGDPAFADVPIADLLSDAYSRERAHLIAERASVQLQPGAPGGRSPRLPDYPTAAAAGAGGGEPTIANLDATDGDVDARGSTRGDTCQVSVTDRWGNVVSITPSGGWLQSSPVVPELGFCLGTRAQMFWLQPGLASSLRPRSRPRTTLSPTMVMRDSAPWLAFGTPGGDQQDQWTLNFFLSIVDGGLSLAQAMDAPMFHTAHAPSSFAPRVGRPGVVIAESRLGSDVIAELRERGHEVEIVDGWMLGRMCAVARDGARLQAAANARGMQGYAIAR